MAIRKDIVFTVAADGRSVTPTVPQDGGVQGEHNATRVIFHVGENSVWENPDYTVYIECEDNAGNIDTTEPLAVEGGQVAVLLPQAWTQYGGISTLRLVAEGADGTIAYMAEGAVRFTSRQNASQKVDGLLKGRMAEMERRAGAALTAAEAAEKSAEDVLAAAETAKNVAEEKASAVSATAQNVLEAETRIERRETNVNGAATAALDAASRAATSAESVFMHASSAGQAAANAEGLAKAAQAAAQQASDEIEAARDTLGGYVVKTSQYAVKSEQSALAAERAAEEAKRIEEKIDSVALPTLKFTVTKTDGGYTSSKTFQELSDALAAGRVVICVLNGIELPVVNENPEGITFAADISGTQYYVSFDSNSSRVSVNIFAPSIKIGDQMWGGEDEEFDIDFTDVINEMIDGKVSKIAPAANLGVINVRDPKYGAKGDGVNDDTGAIQTALHDAEKSGLPLYIPAGNYLVKKTITTYRRKSDGTTGDGQSKALHIFGAGMNTVFTTSPDFECDPAMPYVFVIDVASAQPRQLWVHDFAIDLVADVSGIYFDEIGMKSVVENLWITYLYDKEPDLRDPHDTGREATNARSGIYCRMATVTTFQRIKVYGNRKRIGSGHENIGILCAGSWSTKFIDCDIIFCRWAIYLNSGSNNSIEYCRIDENEYGVFQNTVNIDDENEAYYMLGTRAEYDFKGTLNNLTIRQNRFEGNNQQAIFLAAFGTGTYNYMYNSGVVISENFFDHLGPSRAFQTSNRYVFRKAIHLYRNQGVVIENNTFKGAPSDDASIERLVMAYEFKAEDVEGNLADAKAKAPIQNLYGTMIEDISMRGNTALAHPATLRIADADGNKVIVHLKDEADNEIYWKTSVLIDPAFLNYKGAKVDAPPTLAELGFVSDITADQSSRDRLGNIGAALDGIIAIQESLIGGDGE